MDPPTELPPPKPTWTQQMQSNPTHRLSLPSIIRLPAATTTGFIVGAGLGLSHGAKTTSMRFRAENSHRFPTTQTGWYLYHKTKNYNVMLGSLKEGLKMGSKLAVWAGAFFLIEEAVDHTRGSKDFLSTVVAGLSVAGAFSAWNRFPIPTAARTARLGLYGGLAFGLAQDALGFARGRRIGYIDFVLRRKREDLKLEEVGT